MMLMTKELKARFAAVGSQEGKGGEAIVIAKFFSCRSGWTWYATEMCYNLSDGREVNVADADPNLRWMRNGSDPRPLQKKHPKNDALHAVSQQKNRPHESQGGSLRPEESELGRRNDEVKRLHLPQDAEASRRDEERLREEGDRGPGKETGASPSAGHLRTSSERGHVGRPGAESSGDDKVKASVPSHEGQQTLDEAPGIVGITFFGLVQGVEIEYGSFSMDEFESIPGPLGIERDRNYPERPIKDLAKVNPGLRDFLTMMKYA